MKTKVAALLWLLLLAGSAVAQSNNEQQLPCTMNVKLLEVKHRSAQMLADVLAGLLSGPGGGRIVTPNQTLKTLTVRDCAANITVIEQALAKLDVPEQSPANMEFQLHLLTASTKAVEGGAIPKQLEPVVAQLKSTLKYANYRYVYSALNRISNGGRVESSGVTGELFPAPASVATTPTNPSFYQYMLQNVKFTQDATGKDSVQIEQFKFGISVPIQVPAGTQYKDIGLVTPLSLREGELAVVGTANISGSDEAMIIVVSVKKLK